MGKALRRALTALAVLVIAFAVTVTAYRTLKPADTFTKATRPLESPEPVKSIQYGELHSAPLIVDGTVRVYADQRRVYADTPVTAIREMTPHWAFRRWPAEVVSITAIDKSKVGGSVSVVITKWSDGVVAALNATTGDSIWQARIEPASGETFQGRRTAATTVWFPPGLYTSASAVTKRPVVIVTGKDKSVAFDPWSGAQRWSRTFTGHPGLTGCYTTAWTGLTTYAVKDSCAQPALLEIYDADTGVKLSQWRPPGASIGPAAVSNWYVQPSSCQTGNSLCALFKAGATGDVVSFTAAAEGVGKITPSYWKIGPNGAVAAQPFLDKDAVFMIGDTLVQQVITDYIWASSATTGKQLWRSEVAGTLIAADDKNVYVINRQYQLLVLDRLTGAVTSSTELRIRPEDKWVFKYAYLHDGYLAVERLQPGNTTSDVDERYYFSDTPVVLVGV